MFTQAHYLKKGFMGGSNNSSNLSLDFKPSKSKRAI